VAYETADGEPAKQAAEPDVRYMSIGDLEGLIAETKAKMEAAASELDFVQAAQHRDEMYALQKQLKLRKGVAYS